MSFIVEVAVLYWYDLLVIQSHINCACFIAAIGRPWFMFGPIEFSLCLVATTEVVKGWLLVEQIVVILNYVVFVLPIKLQINYCSLLI